MVLTSSSNFSSLAQEAHNLVSALNNLKSEYNVYLDSYNNKISNVTLASWNDEVSSKLDTLLVNLKGEFYKTMYDELISGSFINLINYSNELASKLDECSRLSALVADLKPKVDAYYESQKHDNPGIISSLKNAETSLSSNIQLANNLIKIIESLRFGGGGEVYVPDYENVLANVDNNRDSWTTPVSITSRNNPFKYMEYGDVTIVLHKDEVVFYRCFDESGALCYYDANHNPLTAEQVKDIESKYY
jgi:hypothetical protein